MPTNKVQLRTIEQFMSDYTPIYQPLYPLLLGKSQQYSEEVGKVDFKRANTVGDIRARHITPKDTEIRQIAVGGSVKSFKKYFLANQYIESNLQDQQNIDEITAQVLDEHQKQADELMLFGEGTNNSDVVNNGLYWSSDPNFTLQTNYVVNTSGDSLISFYNGIMSQTAIADNLPGRKAIIFYGQNAVSRLNGLYANQPVSFRRVLADAIGATYDFIQMPTDVTPAGQSGFIIVNLDQVKLHYCALPALKAQGVNEEKMYAWFNYLMSSMMVEALAKNAIIRQPITLSA